MVRIAGGLFMYNHTRRLPEIYRWVEQALALPDSHRHRLARHARLHRAYAMYMNNELAAAEAEIRAVLAEGGRRRRSAQTAGPRACLRRWPCTTRPRGGSRATDREKQKTAPVGAARTMTTIWPKPCGTDARSPCSG